MHKKLILFTLLILSFFRTFADEGMWLPLLIPRLNYTDMQKMGLKLTPEEIYSVNNASLKDAVVMLNNGSCTAEAISKEGLLLTNHHCAYKAIQSHSTVADDYLTNGFWAMKRSEEKPNAGMTASFLIRMEDVTPKIMAALANITTEDERTAKVEEMSKQLANEAIAGTHYTGEVKEFFEGNEYYLFVYEVFKDVRLVGAPPSAIGKFGGDTDNWMWPRHTGDFSLLRVYTGKDGKPADYSPDNVPMKPRYHFPISLNGVSEGDFAMVMGYPGSTDRYLPSLGVELAIQETNLTRVKIRDTKLKLMKQDMDLDEDIRIKYAAKYAQVSNYWKYFIGQTEGLKRLKVYDKKKAEEAAFQTWVNADPERKKKYGSALQDIAQGYQEYKTYNLSNVYLSEAALGPDISLFVYRFNSLYQLLTTDKNNKQAIAERIEALKKVTKDHFQNYSVATDKNIFEAMMKMYLDDIPLSQLPDIFEVVQKKYKGDFRAFTEAVFSKTIFTSDQKVLEFLNKPSAKTLEKDLAFQAVSSILSNYFGKIVPGIQKASILLDRGNRLYIAGAQEMNTDKKYYPNANSTMRLTYGTVKDYYPKDGVHYLYQTTLEGVMEKKDSTNEEFIVPDKLEQLYKSKDYGRYGVDGILPTCFITTNDITGGNSGSPVINGQGQLIGTAFDANWEAMSGDIAFEPKLQRCINVDIRYTLFIIEKYAGAKHLVDEMTIVHSNVTDSKATQPAQVEN